ncbi:8-oxo-dGTP diphosphatase [Tamaricihabitans halophyticus]|uniref:8-oxo-dGTP diphosphatase n=1 Tax=Tamaricihabitans halophyticus TaxID=1262583 RepID=A0A4R2R4X7_9PSEU|nr:NUDIX hydrolase [Tamaricihabitans halophyticus]TCP56984.1 8-oxo-dGTP diphosphatase [Tamaricihabitans halophyticus]
MDEPTTAVTADVVVFAVRPQDQTTHVLLVQRDGDPFAGCWALPGGFKENGESPATAAARELAEETGLTDVDLMQVGAYGDPGRDPRGDVVTIAYTTVLDGMPAPTAGDDAQAAQWVAIDTAVNPNAVAFDHHHIIRDAYYRAACQLVALGA